jgi:tryptophan synthase beta chain
VACFKSAVDFARTEGIIIAPETSHAVKVVVDEALKAKKENKEKTILFNCSGHGHFDMAAYEAYFSGKLKDYEFSEAELKASLKYLPQLDSLCGGG